MPRPFAPAPAAFFPTLPPAPASFAQTAYAPSAQPVFISHAGEDDSVAADICRLLELEGIRCWLSPRDIHPRRASGAQTIDAIESSSAMVLVLSACSNASVFVANEVERAVSKGKTVVVLRVEPVRPSPALELFVSRSQWIDAWTPPLEEPVQVLAAAIRNLLGMPSRPVKAPRAEGRSGSRRSPVSGRMLGVGLAVVAAVVLVGGLLFFVSRGPAPAPSRSPVAVASATPKLIATPEVTRSASPIVSSAAPSSGRLPVFSATGSMAQSRELETGTMLSNGHVLIAGGDDGGAGFATAELFDPATGKFSPTGNMTSARWGHTATILIGGGVLIAGGAKGSTVLSSAELYDPATGKFTATGSMAHPRLRFTATRLADGRVLVTGGDDATSLYASAEIYDPATGKFTPTGSMISARESHTATLLPDGRVLIAGGWDGTTALDSAELYDPGTGKFSKTGSMAESRLRFTATPLGDGRVLVAAGAYDLQGTSRLTAEVYNPVTGTFSQTGSLAEARKDHTATLLSDGRVLIVGGWSITSPALKSVETYDPKSGSFSPAGSMAVARQSGAATRLPDGRVLIVGGSDGSEALASAEICQP